MKNHFQLKAEHITYNSKQQYKMCLLFRRFVFLLVFTAKVSITCFTEARWGVSYNLKRMHRPENQENYFSNKMQFKNNIKRDLKRIATES